MAGKAGVRPALVHYYFSSMDDLFVAVLRAGAERTLQRQRQAVTGDEPLHALWRLNSTQGAQLMLEFMALANHRKAIRTEIAAYAERYGEMEAAALTEAMRAHGVDMQEFPPVVMSMILTSLARIMPEELGSRVGGYPYFCQDDDRDPAKDVLLLQLDSDESMQWGDGGTAHFFISEDDLSARRFSAVQYTWNGM